MKAVITAGGKGTRVATVNAQTPKPMLPINGKPVLQHQIECLQRQGIVDITLTIGYLGEQIRSFFVDGQAFGVSIDYVQETLPLGTAGALYYLKERMQEDFLLINGDLIFDVDCHRLMAFHKAHEAAATLLVHPNDHPEDSSLIVADADGQVTNWLAKEDSRQWYQNCVNAGIHVLAPRLLDALDAPRKIDLDRDLLRPGIPLGHIYAYRSPEYIKDMGTPERIASVERDLQMGLVVQKNLECKQRAIFLDRDGTINRYVGFLRDIDELVLLDGAAQAIHKINQSGYLAIIVTNQPVIARGEVTWQNLRCIHDKLETLLGQAGAYVDHIYICPHHPDRGFLGEVEKYKTACGCRKPNPGLLLQAAEEYNIDLTKSWMVGDSPQDIVAGMAAGCHTMQVSDTMPLAVAVAHIAHEERWHV